MTTNFPRKLYFILIVAAFVALWEFFYFLGFISPARISHPLAIFDTLEESDFRRGFFKVMLTQIVLALTLGGGVGYLIGSLVRRNGWLSRTTIAFLRIVRWLPFFLYWTSPTWPPIANNDYDPVIFAFVTGILTVSLTACYAYVNSIAMPIMASHERRSWVLAEAISQAILISVFSQVWVGSHGWLLSAIMPGRVAVSYTALLLLVVFLFLMHRLLFTTFDETLRLRRLVVISELAVNRNSGTGCFIATAFFLFVWHALSVVFYSSISSPWEVVQTLYRLFVQNEPVAFMNTTVWRHITESTIDLTEGLVVGGGIAVGVVQLLSTFPSLQSRLFPILYVTHVISLLLSLLFIHWFGLSGSSQAVVQVASITIFPLVEVLWALAKQPWSSRILFAVQHALPLALLGLLFGGLWGSEAGLGFFLSATHAYRLAPDGMAAVVSVLVFLILVSWGVRALVIRKGIEFPVKSS